MSAQTANSQFAFQLPSLSYIDAKWEEPNLHAPAAAPARARKAGLGAWLSRQVAGVVARVRDGQAIAELSSMSDYELMDIGLNRSDVPRVLQPAFNQDLRQRGAQI
jgi:uncharacterized protein YjiS (DUF1127 family)